MYAGAVSVLVARNSEIWRWRASWRLRSRPGLYCSDQFRASAPLRSRARWCCLVPGLAHVGPIESGVDRVLEVAIGGGRHP